jgi:Spy/CpxP family protein refolding chaperone
MNKKILLSSVMVAGMTLLAASTYAATGTSSTWISTSLKAKLGNSFVQGNAGFGLGGGHFAMSLTDAEKTSLASMTDEQKKAFYETKRVAAEAKMEARETVIDKLLAGTSLTASEETIRQELIKERAEHKVKHAEKKALMAKIQAILEKKKAGTTLTADEQATLDSMPKGGGRDKGGKRGGWKRK